MGATDPKNVRAPAAAGAGAHSEGYEAGLFEKIINYALCRTDLAKRKMPMKPVSLVQLFRYGTRVDTILIFLGVIGAIVSGAGQPFVAVAAGGMVNVFLVQNDTQSQEFRDGTYK
uniref:Uncharacterized protein n=1 Tax=Plectus sambesii TaxID=2011161 RepID=A0A914VV79_9BILA